MNRDEMMKMSWKAYQEVCYQHPRMDVPILCLLVEIDFDDDSMTLQPLFGEDYINKDFVAGIQHCSIPKRKIQAAIVNGKKVNNKKHLPLFEGSTNRINPYFEYKNINPDHAS